MLRMIRKCIRKLCPRPVSPARGTEIDAAHVVRRAVRRYGRKTADADGVIGKSEWRGILFQDKAPFSQQYFVYCKKKQRGIGTEDTPGAAGDHAIGIHRGEASSSACAAMVRAWLRKRRIIPSNRSLTRRDQRTPAAIPAAAEFSGMVSSVSSEQAAYRSLPRQRESSLATLLLLFKSQPLRWVVI